MTEKLISLSLYSRWLVAQCLQSLAGIYEMFCNTLLHKRHTVSWAIISPVYINPKGQTRIIILPFCTYFCTSGTAETGWQHKILRFTYNVGYTCTYCSSIWLFTYIPLFSHWYTINKIQNYCYCTLFLQQCCS